MSGAFEKLFVPGRIGTMEVRNRIAMAPMGTQMYAEGFVTQQLKDYYEARAKGGVGMITIDHLKISYPVGAGKKNTARIDDDKFIPGLSELLEVVHRHGVKMVAQLGHMGPADIARGTAQPLAASALSRQADYTHPPSSVVDYSQPRAMTREEIAHTTQLWVQAALRAKKAGFDAVQVHAANRYLLASFVSPYWNRRTDEYGGPLENRARFALEVVRAVRKAVGPDYPILCRVNGEERDVQGGVTIELAAEFSRLLEAAGVDGIDVSSMHPHSPEYSPAFNVRAAAAIRKAVKIPVIVAGRLGPELGEQVLRDGDADFICIGRPLIADPELPAKAAAGRMDDVVPCVYCVNCLAVDRECTVNPAWGKELEHAIVPATKRRKVLVVGGGPGGMQAARIAAMRGHEVTLYEKEAQLGGQLRVASLLREEYGRLSGFLAHQIEKLGVTVVCGQAVDAALVEKLRPEAVIVCTGATCRTPDIPGIERAHEASADAIGAIAPSGKRLVVVGRGLPGIVLAHFFVGRGARVTLVDTHGDLPFGERPMPVLREYMKGALDAHGARTVIASKYEQVSEHGLTIVNCAGEREVLEGDTVVFAADYRPENTLAAALSAAGCEVHVVGDCVKPCGILDAIHDASAAARAI